MSNQTCYRVCSVYANNVPIACVELVANARQVPDRPAPILRLSHSDRVIELSRLVGCHHLIIRSWSVKSDGQDIGRIRATAGRSAEVKVILSGHVEPRPCRDIRLA